MVIVETTQEFDRALKVLKSTPHIVIPIFTDANRHPALNEIAVLYYAVRGGDSFVFCFNHNDAQNLDAAKLSLLGQLTSYAPDAKRMLHVFPGAQFIDLAGMTFLQSGKLIDETKCYPAVVRRLHALYRQQKGLNRAVPLMKLIEHCDAYSAQLKGVIRAGVPAGFNFHNEVVIPATFFMERSGVHVDLELFSMAFPDKRVELDQALFFTEFNPYTITGRVTSKFQTVNTSALNKSDGTRLAFQSRFMKGVMVNVDYESFHLRLIGEMIGFDLPEGSLHEYFGKQYFNVAELTPKQYEESKVRTFQNLYNNERLGHDIPFFKKVYEFVDTLWTELEECGKIHSPTGREIHWTQLENPSKAKLFNYFLQLREMEVTMTAIHALIPKFAGKSSKVVLYTYDSLLIDYDLTDGKELLQEVVRVLECDGKYPVRVYMGTSYGALKNVTTTVKRSCVGIV